MQSIQDNTSVIDVGYWHQLQDGRLQCDLCPRYCKLRDGQRGLCFVRGRRGETMVLTTYGRSSGFCIDPIEKKPLNHFYPGSKVFSFGTAGCNLACKYCQNWDISKSQEIDTLADSASPERIAQAALAHECQSVAFTYNDPVIFHEYAIDVAKACHELDIRTVAVTAGYVCPEPRAEFYRHIDAVNVDLKAFRERFYYKITGSHLKPVLETLEYIKHETNCWLEITTLIIPGENDSDEEIHELTEWVVNTLGPDVPIHFSAFHPDWKMLDINPTPPSSLIRARKIAINNGAYYAYTGNIHDHKGSSTYCHQCSNTLIGRDWYTLKEWDLTEKGKCRQCGTICAGYFNDQPGNWGNRTQVVRMSHQGSF